MIRPTSTTSSLLAAAAVLVLLLTAPAAAAADADGGTLSRTAAGGLRYTAGAGEANLVTTSTRGAELLLADTGGSLAGPLPSACVPEPADEGFAVRCAAPGNTVLQVDLGDGDDWLDGELLAGRISLRADAGPGEDVVIGGAGDDRIDGGEGRDTLYGLGGDDEVGGGAGSDYVRGHAGDDLVDSGSRGDTSSEINFLIGDGGDDRLLGGAGIDYAAGNGGDDRIDAGGSLDDLAGGEGDDELIGGPGDDSLRGGPGTDRLRGGPGADTLGAVDGEADRLDCGAGAGDLARTDPGRLDRADASCERVRAA